MRRVLRFATARTVLPAVAVIALAGAAADELSSYTVSDATAATLTGGACNSATTTNGTRGCLTSSCPLDNSQAGGTGSECVQNQSCSDCMCTYSAVTCGHTCTGCGPPG
jgi:hypothetical protein